MAIKRRRRAQKTNPNIVLLVVAAAVALGLSSIFGKSLGGILNFSVLALIVFGSLLAIFLVWFIPYQANQRSQRQKAVTGEDVDNMSWSDFEDFVIQLLMSQKYKINAHPSGPGDQGADIIASKDGDKFAVQVKHYKTKLNNSPIQEAVAAMAQYHCTRSMVITNSHFTAGAKILAASNNCILVDREKLGEWILELESISQR
jgi:HJR/Mrr/RecB family endonuclease